MIISILKNTGRVIAIPFKYLVKGAIYGGKAIARSVKRKKKEE